MYEMKHSSMRQKDVRAINLASKKYQRGEADATSIVKATKVFSLMRSVELFIIEQLGIPILPFASIWVQKRLNLFG